MAGSDTRQGFRSNHYIGRETAYSTPVAVTACMPHCLGVEIEPIVEKEPNEALYGKRVRRKPIMGFSKYRFKATFYASYGEIEMIIAAAVGSSAVVVAVAPQYEYLYTPADTMVKDGADTKAMSFTWVSRLLALTGVSASGNDIRELAGLKVNTCKFTWKAGKPVMVEVTGTCFARLDTSATNTDTVLNALSTAGLGAPVMVYRPADSIVRLRDNLGAMTGTHNVQPTEISFSIDNSYDEEYASDGLVEPEPDGFSKYTLEMSMPRLSNNTWRGWVDANTDAQALIQMTDPSSVTNITEYRFGAMTLASPIGEDPKDAKTIRPKLKFELHGAELGNPTWASMAEAFEIDVKTTRWAANPLVA